MRGLSLYSLLEYILAVALVIVEVSLLIQFYYYNMSSNFNNLQYLYFMNEMYEERFFYCLYKATNNPYYLFYIPPVQDINSISNSTSNYIYYCNSQQTFQFYNLTGNYTSGNYTTLVYENITETIIPTYAFFDSTDMSKFFLFNKYILEKFVKQYGAEKAAEATQSALDAFVSTITFQWQDTISNIQSAATDTYQALQAVYTESELSAFNGSENLEIFHSFFANLSKNPNENGYMFTPITAPTLLVVDTNNHLYSYSIYDFGYISAVQCNETINDAQLLLCRQEYNSNDYSKARKCFEKAIKIKC